MLSVGLKCSRISANSSKQTRIEVRVYNRSSRHRSACSSDYLMLCHIATAVRHVSTCVAVASAVSSFDDHSIHIKPALLLGFTTYNDMDGITRVVFEYGSHVKDGEMVIGTACG